MIIIKVNANKVINMLTGYTRTIPQGGNEGIRKVAEYGTFALKDEAIKANIKPWRGVLNRSIRAVKKSKSSWVIKMAKHGVYLDSMRPHWVSLKRGRLITQWAKDRGIIANVSGGYGEVWMYPVNKRSVYVRPHPFIAHAVTRMNRKAKTIVEKEINKAIRRKGR